VFIRAPVHAELLCLSLFFRFFIQEIKQFFLVNKTSPPTAFIAGIEKCVVDFRLEFKLCSISCRTFYSPTSSSVNEDFGDLLEI
jgi:hypothetical protein